MKNNKYSALIVQGGGQRGAFAAGVLDCFIQQQYDPFKLYIGTSAGALNLCTFITKQDGAGLDFILNLTTSDKFFDLSKLIRNKEGMNLDWAFSHMQSSDMPIDLKRGLAHLGEHREALACVTNADNLQQSYYPIFTENWFEVLKATCAIPLLYNNEVSFDNQQWVDGSVADTIPVQEAVRREHKNIIVITTALATVPETDSYTSFDLLKNSIEKNITLYRQQLETQHSFEKLQILKKEILTKLSTVKKLNTEKILPESAQIWFEQKQLELKKTSTQIKQNFANTSQYKAMEMYQAHTLNHAQNMAYIQQPPAGIHIHQICPTQALESKGLLSERIHIINDYSHGKAIALDFLKGLKQDNKQPLEDVSIVQ